ncbi:DUF2087 domain-containing protein [Streptomyces kanasensis]|uniref:DUF2087 domain-containing protein n=1 Tax=Streptomyces kanasensis TaxID=936756 RepID=UPI0036F797F6
MSAHTTSSLGVSALFDGSGRLTAIPRRPARREQLLAHLTETLFEEGRPYSEPEVNEALRTVHDDCSALRRYLVVAGHLSRTRDGRTYHRAATTTLPPTA